MRILLIAAVLLVAPAHAQTFRWAAGKLDCGYGLEMRGTSAQCRGREQATSFLVVAYPGTRTLVIRYDGDTTKAPQRWTADLAAPAPVVIVHGATIVIGSVAGGTAHLQTLDAATGKPRAAGDVATGVTAIQLESQGATLRVHARTPDGGGQLIDIDPATLKPTATRAIAAAAIRTTHDPHAAPANGEGRAGGVRVAWDQAALVLHAGTHTEKLVDDDRFRMQLVTLQTAGDRVLVTLHHPAASGANAFAFDIKTGARLWATHVTGIGSVAHSAYSNQVSALVAGDLLVVQGVEAGGAYACTIAIADGQERACVDHLTGTAVFVPPAPAVVAKPIPHKVGPTTTAVRCKRSRSPRQALALKSWTSGPLAGTITTPSTSCKPKLFGGIVGDRIELVVHETASGPAVCECTIGFSQETNGDSRMVIAKHGDAELARQPLAP